MTKAILCLDSSGRSLLQDMKLADYLPDLWFDYLYIPVPHDAPSGFGFFEACLRSQANLMTKIDTHDASSEYLIDLKASLDRLMHYDQIEIWLGSSLQDHIFTFHLLDILSRQDAILEKTFIQHLPQPAGLMNEAQVSKVRNSATPVSADLLKEARTYWAAYRSSTPELWIALLSTPSQHFPKLNLIHKKFALQLPIKPTNLRLVDRQILKHMKRGMDTTVHLLGNVISDEYPHNAVITKESYIWKAIWDLAAGQTPALSGLPLDPFHYFSDNISDQEKRKLCFKSQPKLTPYGEALLSERAVWSENNIIDYWWGGTHITNDNLWTFDAKTSKLFAP